MPRVTPEHAAGRRLQILDAARIAFVRDGFHVTSMQDIQREAALSAGAIYLYFKSKDEIVAAIAADALSRLSVVLDTSPTDGTSADLNLLVDRFLHVSERLRDEKHIFPLIIQIWAEALRNPSLLAALTALFSQMKGRLVTLVAQSQASGQIDPGVDPESLAMALVGLGQGYIIQSTLLPEATSLEGYRAGVHALLRAGAPRPPS